MRDHNGQLGLARMRDHNGQLGSQDRDWLKRTAQLCQIDEIACSDGHLVHKQFHLEGADVSLADSNRIGGRHTVGEQPCRQTPRREQGGTAQHFLWQCRV